MKRIAVLHPLLGFAGGAENLILWAAEEMARRGIETTAFARNLPDPMPSFLKGKVTALDLRVWKWPAVTRQLAGDLPGFDGVIFHNFPASIYTDFARKRLKGAMPPDLFYCHEPCRPWYGTDRQEREQLERRRLLRLDLPMWNNIRMDLAAVSRARAVCGNSGRTAAYAGEVFGRPFPVVYPGIPESFLRAEPPSAPRDRFVFLGRLHPVKNAHGAVAAFAAFQRRNRRPDIPLYIVGEGDGEGPARQEAIRQGVDGLVHFTGFLPKAEVEAHLDRALAVLNIPYQEPFGLVTPECWARFTPVIVSKDSGSAEAITHGVDGFAVDPGNPDEIATCMVRLSEEKNLAGQFAASGRRRVAEAFLIRHHVDGLLGLLQKP